MPTEPPDLPPSAASPASAALAADAVAAEAAGHRGHTAGNTHCLNCGTRLQGPYCHACGQHDFDVHRSFGHTFLEALENLFHFDGKFFRNIVTLLFQPGRLTAEFNAGKRAAQVPPFRLYIFTAFVFFLLILADTDPDNAIRLGPGPAGGRSEFTVDGKPVTAEQAMRAATDRAYAEQLSRELAAQPAPPTPTANRPGLSIQRSAKPEAEMSELEKWAEEQARRAAQPEYRRELGRKFLAALPKMLLLCLPFFAFYTWILFRRCGQVYLQHLVIALHFHTFIFLWVLFRDGWAFALSWLPFVKNLLLLACNAWLVLYPLLMLRRLFAQSWIRTGLKTLALALAYVFTLALGFFLTGLILVLLS